MTREQALKVMIGLGVNEVFKQDRDNIDEVAAEVFMTVAFGTASQSGSCLDDIINEARDVLFPKKTQVLN